MEVLQLEGVENARDLGGTPVAGGRRIARGRLFRGGALHRATSRDCAELFEQRAITCVIDLRTGWERAAKPDVNHPGIENLFIPLYDKAVVGVEYTRPAPGTIPDGDDFACEPLHFYHSLANPRTVDQMRCAVHAAFDRMEQRQGVYIHCSGGKDRAGIVAALLLGVLGANREAILQDYLFTNVSRDANYDKMLARFRRFAQGDEAFARQLTDAHRALPENLAAFYDAIEAAYGSMDDFMRVQLDLTDARIAKLREACTDGA